MSTKIIAVNARVYYRLAEAKRRGESFSEAIDRLLADSAAAHTGGDILRGLGSVSPLSSMDAEILLEVVRENREAQIRSR